MVLHWQVLTPGRHWPASQLSPWVQGSPSSQAALAGPGRLMQPAMGLHLSVVQAFSSSQLSDEGPEHAPCVQLSPVVQALPSEHGVQAAAEVKAQVPLLVQLPITQGEAE